MPLWYERFAAMAARVPNLPALVTPGGTLTYAQLLARAEHWQREHAAESGRVVIVHTDALETMVALIAAWRSDRAVALLQPAMASGALEAVQARLARPVPAGCGGAPDLQEALVLATSGTTGLPKLVAHSHRSIAAMTAHLIDWYAKPARMRTLVAVPLAMVTGLAQTLIGLAAGWTVYLYPTGTPMPALLDVLRQEKIQILAGTAAFHRVLMGYAPGKAFPQMRHVRGSGEPMEPALMAQLRAAYPNAEQFHAYGASDAGWRIAVLPVDDPRLLQGAIGVPLLHYQTQIRPMPGLPPGHGELFVRGDMVCLGYVGPDGGYEGLSPDGWLATRDIAHVDADGCLYLHGRVDTLFKSGGRWVNPVEVERVLSQLPGVRDVRCFPEPHALLGQMPVAEVVPAPGSTLRPVDLRLHCAPQLEPHQLPREFRIVAEVSHGASGKKLRQP